MHNYNAISFVKLKKFDLAIESWDKAIKIQPNFAEAYNNKGGCLVEIKQFENALKNFEAAIKIKPNFAEAYNNKAIVLTKIKEYENALKNFEAAIKIKPNFSEPYIGIGNLFKDNLDKLGEAIKFYEKGIELNPNSKNALSALIFTKLQLCEWKSYISDLEKLKKKIINKINFSNAFHILAFYDSLEIQNKNIKMYMDDRFSKKKTFEPIIDKYYNKKIRIGYYSSDFRNHAVCYQLVNLIELHDKSKFEIIGMSLGKKNNDEIRNRIVKAFDEFHELHEKTDHEIIQLSRNLKIDIAIDLMGFTQNNRFNIFKIGCAPIQINFLGYAGTTGSKFIDYIIADKIVIPKEKQKNYSEKIIYLPHCFMINDDSKNASLDQVKKENYNLPKNKFVFANFNKFYKITPNIFNTWMQLLAKIPNSILWLANDNNTGRKNIVKKAIESGLHEDRIFFADKMPKYADYIERLKNIDLYLDTYPYSSHVIGCDVVKADVPIVTLSGETFASNVCASILNDLKLSELITKNIDEYKNKIIEICKSEEILKKIKTKLKENKKNSVLFNSKIYVQNFENSLEQVYMNFIKNKIPENIFIDN